MSCRRWVFSILVVSASVPAAPSAEDRFCRNGAFPAYGPPFNVGVVRGKPGERVRFQNDTDGCPSSADTRCDKKRTSCLAMK
jgi:hypothetical protein